MAINFWRLLDTLEMIPQQGKLQASVLLQRLRDRGYKVSLRSVQRDLTFLEKHFHIQCDGAKPAGWHWPRKVRRISLPGMGWPEALALYLAQRHLEGMLPASIYQQLSGYFDEAKRKLQQHFGNAYSRWPAKIYVGTRGQPMLSPTIQRTVRDTVMEALLGDRQLRIRYRSTRRSEEQEWRIHPLGMFQDGRTFYLAVRIEDEERTRTLAMHRILKATPLPDRVAPPKDCPSFQDWAKTALGFGGSGTIRLTADFFDNAGRHLLESPLSADQSHRVMDEHAGHLRITATVANTEGLGRWLLGFGNRVEVLAPVDLRGEIAQRLNDAIARYEQKATTRLRALA